MLSSLGGCSIPYGSVDIVVAGLHLRWHGVFQRPNHLLTRFATDLPVVILEEPIVDGSVSDAVGTLGDIAVITPHRAHAADAIDDRAIDAVRKVVGERRPLIWLYTPMMAALADAFPDAPLVYDKMDELASFAHADPRIAQRERVVLERADVVFSGGRSLYRTIETRTRNPHCFPSGVDIAHFETALSRVPHPDLAPYRNGAIFGYIGVIDERLDLALIDALAEALPAATLVFVGPVVKIDPATLPRRSNIAYLGPRAYEELPALLAGFDVALMPFAMNEHTRNISPTKTLEYFAAGRPVVSTAVADVVADHGDVVYIAHTAPEFIDAVARAAAGDPLRARRAAVRAAGASWDAIAEAMRAEMHAAGIDISAAVGASGSSR